MFIATKRLLEAETALKQLQNDMKALQSQWDMERIHLADLKEQATRTINRLQQQKRREEAKEPNGEPQRPMNPLAQQLLKGKSDVVLPR